MPVPIVIVTEHEVANAGDLGQVPRDEVVGAKQSAAALTIILSQLDEPELARALGEDTLQRCRRVLGPDHLITLTAAATLTFTLAQLGEAEAARTLAEDTLQRCHRVLGPGHRITRSLTRVAKTGLIPRKDSVADRPGRPT